MNEAVLIWEENSKDSDGFPIAIKHRKETYAREKSVARAEAYEAMRSKVNISTVLEIRLEDWEETRHIVNGKPEYARKIEYDGCTYSIVRAYKKGKSAIELTCG